MGVKAKRPTNIPTAPTAATMIRRQTADEQIIARRLFLPDVTELSA